MYNQKNWEVFLLDLWPIIPTFQDYMMIDWLILALWAYSVLIPIKNRSQALFLVSIVEILWGFYDISISEYAQSIPFFCYAVVTFVSSRKANLEVRQ
jgi:hypothetical protein